MDTLFSNIILHLLLSLYIQKSDGEYPANANTRGIINIAYAEERVIVVMDPD